MRSLEAARTSWQDLKRYESLAELKEAVRLDGRSSIATEGCRSACWKAFLLFDTLDVSTWQRTLSASRSAYNSLRSHCLRHLENPDELEANYDPLGQEVEASLSARIRQDEELRSEILQDVNRCMPENLYFRQPDTQRMLLDILFIFCKLNPDVSYRQGMHELLAPILWVVERDAIDLGQSSKAMGENATIVNIFDPDHVEHDTYALFGEVMQSAKNFYEQTTTSANENPIVSRSRRIFSELLPKVDEDLAKHLESIDIIPQVFLMRWIRLMFGREFSFDDMLTIWDVIFAEDATLDIVNEICLVMLLRIRWYLIDADYNEALTLLLRYPEVEDDFSPQTFALDAVYLREHMDYHGGSYLISKYSGRRVYQTKRPATPPALQRKVTTVSGPHTDTAALSVSKESSPRLSGPARNIEKVFQSTAKEIYARGERLGIGKVVRNAVDEVHKRAQEIRDAPTPSPPRTHQQRRSQSSLGPFPLQDKVKSLEDRSIQLAKLLEGALKELWAFQKRTAEGLDAENETSLPNAEDLSVAIAKVQFVQVYLGDPKLLLPSDTSGTDNVSQATRENNEVVEALSIQSEQSANDPADTGASTLQQARRNADGSPASGPSRLPASRTPVADFGNPSTHGDPVRMSATSERQAPEIIIENDTPNINLGSATEKLPSEQKSSASRPRLDQSSYSWMLDEPDRSTAPLGQSSQFAPRRGRAQGFLFGEDPSESSTTGR